MADIKSINLSDLYGQNNDSRLPLSQFDTVVAFEQTYSMLQQCASFKRRDRVLRRIMKSRTAESLVLLSQVSMLLSSNTTHSTHTVNFTETKPERSINFKVLVAFNVSFSLPLRLLQFWSLMFCCQKLC